MIFDAHPLLPSGTLQTFAGFLLPQAKISLKEIIHHVPLTDADIVTLIETPPTSKPNSSVTLSLMLVHGLGGSGRDLGLQRMAHAFSIRGVRVFRLNHRGVADGQGKARGIYHAGRASDVLAALHFINELRHSHDILAAAGFSLSGNMLLAMAGQSASGVLERMPHTLRRLIAICPVVDLESSAPVIPGVAFGLIDRHFTQALTRHIKRRHQDYPDLGPHGLPRRFSMPRLDEIYVAGHAGFATARDYYQASSAMPWLPHIKVPTRVILSKDDPINRTLPDVFRNHESIDLTLTHSGGHVGYVAAQPTPLGTRHWIDWAIIHDLATHLGLPLL